MQIPVAMALEVRDTALVNVPDFGGMGAPDPGC